jgi:hypothetical protein
MKSLVVGRPKDARREQVQDDLVQGSSVKRVFHRRGWQLGEDPCHGANSGPIIQIWSEAQSPANGVASEEACPRLDL